MPLGAGERGAISTGDEQTRGREGKEMRRIEEKDLPGKCVRELEELSLLAYREMGGF